MAPPNLLPLLALLAIALPLCPAQDNQSQPALPNAKLVPAPKEPTPFPIDSAPLATGFTIEVRTPDQMTEKDRLAEADAESSIAERAGFADLEFNAGKWSYRQLVCPDFPNHLFLRFTRDNGVGDQSVFSASIPRNGEGHVRVIPILRRSYSLFSPAPINAITIASFNHIRNEEKAGSESSWVGTALCYAALAGANPVAVPVTENAEPGALPGHSGPMLMILPQGGAVIHLPDVSARPRPVVWTLTFNGKGKLTKVERPPETVILPVPVPTAPENDWKPVPQSSSGR
jgi:hypothetical protein